jgi:rubrerythrin
VVFATFRLPINFMDSYLSSAEIVWDLLRIHSERIRIYTHALQNGKETELDIKSIFERIIEESIKCRQQLNEKISEKNNEKGKIYKAWADIKTKPVIDGNKKAILANCMDGELAVLNAYSMALSFVDDKDIKELLQDQQQKLQQMHAHISQYYNAQ